jgi:hypothetical protein
MLETPLAWRTNVRTNLLLWPEVGENIRNLVLEDGQPYDEGALLHALRRRAHGRLPDDRRAVRNTFEILALAGLAYRTGSVRPRFSLTALGRCTFSFLGVGRSRTVANPNNMHLLGRYLVRGLATVAECRAIWMLMRATGDVLTNEELNRAIQRMDTLLDVPETATAVLQARAANDPTKIGPRKYENQKYGTWQANDQRKVMNPIFLHAGGGGVLLSVGDGEERRLAAWAGPMLDQAIASAGPLIHASTEASSVLYISDMAAVPEMDSPR